MLAFQLPIDVAYDAVITMASLLLSVGVSFLLLHMSTQRRLRWPRLLSGGIVTGIGFALVHYMGMASMEMRPQIHYTRWMLAFSLAFSVVSAMLSMRLIFMLNSRKADNLWRRVSAALLIACSIFGLHLIGTAAATFAADSSSVAMGGMDSDNLLTAVTLGSLFVLIAALIFSGAQKPKCSRKSSVAPMTNYCTSRPTMC